MIYKIRFTLLTLHRAERFYRLRLRLDGDADAPAARDAQAHFPFQFEIRGENAGEVGGDHALAGGRERGVCPPQQGAGGARKESGAQTGAVERLLSRT